MGLSTGNFRCFACGRWTLEVTDGGPSPEDDDVAQTYRWTTGVLDVEMRAGPHRAAVACWVCFWKTEPDPWIHEDHWNALNPLVPAEKLPVMLDVDREHRRHEDPASYPWPPDVAVPAEPVTKEAP